MPVVSPASTPLKEPCPRRQATMPIPVRARIGREGGECRSNHEITMSMLPLESQPIHMERIVLGEQDGIINDLSLRCERISCRRTQNLGDIPGRARLCLRCILQHCPHLSLCTYTVPVVCLFAPEQYLCYSRVEQFVPFARRRRIFDTTIRVRRDAGGTGVPGHCQSQTSSLTGGYSKLLAAAIAFGTGARLAPLS